MKKETISSTETVELFLETSEAVRVKKEKIRRLDSACGDGDLGITINKGLKAVEEVLQGLENEAPDLGKVLKKAGMAFNNKAASTFGVFFATACMKSSKKIQGKTKLKLRDIANIFEASVNSIKERGGAKVGDKTILDALVPASKSIQNSLNNKESIPKAFQRAAQAAKKGAENTKGMQPKTGRAKQLGDQATDIQDPGATVIYFFIEEIADKLNS